MALHCIESFIDLFCDLFTNFLLLLGWLKAKDDTCPVVAAVAGTAVVNGTMDLVQSCKVGNGVWVFKEMGGVGRCDGVC